MNLGLWGSTVLIICIAVLCLALGSKRALEYRQLAKTLGFQYLGTKLPGSLRIRDASFWDTFDVTTNAIAGSLKGLDSVAFHLHANHGEMGYKQTTVAIKSPVPLREFSALWKASGIQAERIGEWLILYRPRETVSPELLPAFLDDCFNLLSYLKGEGQF